MDVRRMATLAIAGSLVTLLACNDEIAGPELADRDLAGSGLTATVRLTCSGPTNTGFVHVGAFLDVEWSNGTRVTNLFCSTWGGPTFPRSVEVLVPDVTDRWTAIIGLEGPIFNPKCQFDSETDTGPLRCTYGDGSVDPRLVDNPGDLEAGAIAVIR